MNIKSIVANELDKVITEQSYKEIYNLLEIPPSIELGDVAFPCFKLCQIRKSSPISIANSIKSELGDNYFIKNIEVKSGYLNFYFDKNKYAHNILNLVGTNTNNFGKSSIGNGKTIVIDYSSPNIAKEFHVGHLRSTIIGKALVNIYEKLGYNCVKVNHLGDWGTQFGKLIVAYKYWGNKESVETDGISELLRLYTKFHEEADKDDKLNEEARTWFLKLEQGDKEALKLWKWFKDISLEEYERIYTLLGVSFDSYAGESFYNDKMKEVVEELLKLELLVESEGAQVVNLDKWNMPPCLILKSNGSTLYATRDLAAAIYRKRTYDFSQCLYVTGNSQSLHYEQWFKVLELMGKKGSEKLVHVPFGIVSIEGEKLSTRKGKMVLLDQLIIETIKKVEEIIEDRNIKDPKDVARKIGIGAIIFNELYKKRIKDVSFSWEDSLSFEGETGPYVQYAYVRANRVVANKNINMNLESSYEIEDCEYELVKELNNYGNVIMLAAKDYEPSIVSRYLIKISKLFNKFYYQCTILSKDKEEKEFRLALTKAFTIVSKSAQELIGMECVDEM